MCAAARSAICDQRAAAVIARQAGWNADVRIPRSDAGRQGPGSCAMLRSAPSRCGAGRHDHRACEQGLRPTEQINRCYFRAVYFRASGGSGSNLWPTMRASALTRRAGPRRRGKAPLCPRGDANSSRARLAGHFFSTHRATKQDMAAPLGLDSWRLLQRRLALTLQLIILPARMAARRRR